jgi:hypothetical protein
MIVLSNVTRTLSPPSRHLNGRVKMAATTARHAVLAGLTKQKGLP